MALHADTQKFLTKRNEWRLELAAALSGQLTEEQQKQAQLAAKQAEYEAERDAAFAALAAGETLTPAQLTILGFADNEEAQKVAAEAAGGEGEDEKEPDEEDEDDCEVPGRAEFDPQNPEEPAPCTNVVDRLSSLTPIECFKDPQGWPNSTQLYTDLNEMLKRAKVAPQTTDTQAEIIRLQRQINILESYRKMLLHKKQRACHYLSSWCACMQDEQRSQQELEAHLNWQPVGLIKPGAEQTTEGE